MKARWQALNARFTALSMRERAMVAVAIFAGLVLIADSLFLDPMFKRAQQFARQAAQQQREITALQQQLFILQAESAIDPNAALRAQLAEADKQLADIDRQLGEMEQTLVAPRQMPKVLDRLLRERPGIRLVSLKTLPAEPIRLQEAGSDAKNAPVLMYRHGFELKLAGGYLELTACLAELEASGQQLLWDKVELVAGADRRSTLTLVFQTLSLDESWMAL